MNDERRLDAQLDAARAAGALWASRPVKSRAEALAALSNALLREEATLARLATETMGKPIAQARAEIVKSASAFAYYSEVAPHELAARTQRLDDAFDATIEYRPLGTLLAIVPWNFPYWQVARAIAPALAVGNAVALKHAPITLPIGEAFERIARDAGLPDGLLVALAIDEERTDRTIADPRIAAVTLTGSERAGRAVAASAGAALKKCVLELGGSDAFIILSDADIDAAVRVGIASRFQNTGQSCIAAKRFIIEKALYDDFCARFSAAAATLRVGDPFEETTEIGPMARADLREQIDRQVRESIARGARRLLGGHALDRPGHYYAPTVLAEVRPGMPAFDEETFGPLAALVRAEDAEDAVALANRSRFGLGATVFAGGNERGREIAAKIEAGTLAIATMVASDPRLPFGGVKASGFGRELGPHALFEFANLRTIRYRREHATAT
ncbi:MAG: aldehyde dehydrogenase family protein [Candidatus Baltobacteraceae bacterium]